MFPMIIFPYTLRLSFQPLKSQVPKHRRRARARAPARLVRGLETSEVSEVKRRPEIVGRRKSRRSGHGNYRRWKRRMDAGLPRCQFQDEPCRNWAPCPRPRRREDRYEVRPNERIVMQCERCLTISNPSQVLRHVPLRPAHGRRLMGREQIPYRGGPRAGRHRH